MSQKIDLSQSFYNMHPFNQDQEAHFEVKLLIKKNKELEVKLAEERQKVESLKGKDTTD